MYMEQEFSSFVTGAFLPVTFFAFSHFLPIIHVIKLLGLLFMTSPTALHKVDMK
jgi:hypothetical protein